ALALKAEPIGFGQPAAERRRRQDLHAREFAGADLAAPASEEILRNLRDRVSLERRDFRNWTVLRARRRLARRQFERWPAGFALAVDHLPGRGRRQRRQH